MKNIPITALLVVLLTIYSQNIASQGLYSVSSGDGNTVISVGKNGIVIRSTNGGANWSSGIIASNELRSISSIGNTYWAVGDNGVYCKSTNGGESWSVQTIAAGKNLRSIYFIDINTGWLCGADGIIYKTVNGGANWLSQTTGTGNLLNCIKFTNNLIGWACGVNGTILNTFNGGNDWYLVSNPAGKELYSIDHKGSTVIAAGEYSTVIISTNNGINWSVSDYKIITKSDVNSVYIIDEHIHFTCGGGGFIRKTTDGGNTFSFPLNPMFGDLYNLYFYNQNIGWAVSRKTYAVIKTTDGGNTWQLPAGTNVNYSFQRTLLTGYLHTFGNVISAYNPIQKNVVYSLIKEKIYRSSNLGDNWTNIITIPFENSQSQYFAISSVDTNKMIAHLSGFTGKLYYSSNYGASWIVTIPDLSSGAGIHIEEDPNQPDVLYYGSYTALYKSTNFGLNWSQISAFSGSGNKCDIEISYYNSDIITMALSFPARVLRSTNAGLNFVQVNLGPVINLTTSESPAMSTNPHKPEEVYSLNFNTLNDGIWKSTNYGGNWFQLHNVSFPWGICTAPDDPNVIFCGLWDLIPRPAHISTNGGTSFFTTNTISSDYNANIAIFAYDRGNVLFQQTDGIYKLRVTYNVPAIGIIPISSEVPNEFSLSQNYPNPFNPVTKIRLSLSKESFTKLIVYDILAREVSILVNKNLKAGKYEVDFDAGNLPSGIYFYKLSASDFAETKKMILLK